MKKLLFVHAILLFSLLCTGQINNFGKKSIEIFPLKPLGNQYKIAFDSSKNFTKINFAGVKNKAATIIILPLDNMPCLVPATNFVNQMPVKKILFKTIYPMHTL